MKYFLDQEFHERMHSPLFGKAHHIIELISIGIVAEDGREYYAISKDFDLGAAQKNKWLTENVLNKIEAELFRQQGTFAKSQFNFNLKELLRQYGKTNVQIAKEIKEFILGEIDHDKCKCGERDTCCYCAEQLKISGDNNIQFYGYYADYDWVLFCSLFGTMMNLPDGFPMYCNDLKQTLDEAAKKVPVSYTVELGLISLKLSKYYPKQENEHNAVADARWNKRLHEFINTL